MYQPMLHPDGSRMNFKERANARRQEYQRQVAREVPEPIAVTLSERQRLRQAELDGQRAAAERAAERERIRQAQLPQRPINAFRLLLEQDLLRYRPDTPAGKKRREDLEAKAAERDKAIDAELAEQARIEAFNNDPAIQKAISDAEQGLRDALPQDKGQFAELLAIAREGEVSMYWQGAAALYGQIRERENEKLAELFSKAESERENHDEQLKLVKSAQAGHDAAAQMIEQPPLVQ